VVVEDDPGFGGKRTESGCPFRQKLGEWGWFGRLAPAKVIPDEVWGWDNESVAALIGGIYSADGSLGRIGGKSVSVRLCLTSKRMLEQVRELLQVRFGIYSAEVAPVDVSKKKWAKNPQWILRFAHRSSVRAFLKSIPLVGRKWSQACLLLGFLRDTPSEREENCFSWVGSQDLGLVQTYDLEVDHPDHLFVLASGLVTSNSVQDGGYFAKQLAAAASDLIVTENDCKSREGLPVRIDDKSNIGAVLSQSVAGISRGTVITPKVARQIKAAGIEDIVVRSPISCTAKGGGICRQCAGIREKGNFPDLGDNIGVAASNGVAEPVSQALLSTKHTAGVASAGGSGQVKGFPQISSLATVPKTFPYAATLSELDGRVGKIEDAPQGGKYVFIDQERHYVPADRDVLAEVGQEVEAGDLLSTGTPNPSEIVRHKGIGAGRAYFVEAMQKALKDNRTSADRRNLEVIGRALINHVCVGDDLTNDKFMPDEVVEYSSLASSYKPAADSMPMPVNKAKGMYLQKPVLQYSIGTRVTPSMIKTLGRVGREEVEASPTKPSFSPEMIRVSDNPAYKPDFAIHTGQSQVKRNLARDVRMGGAESKLHGKYFAMPLARGVEFGRPPQGEVGY
jgi:hypothetical protein